MTDIDLSNVGTPVDLAGVPAIGTPPPETLLPQVVTDLRAAVQAAGLAPNQFAFVGQVSKKGGWHGGIIGTVPGGIQVHAWVGQHWDRDVDWGVSAMKVITWGGEK